MKNFFIKHKNLSLFGLLVLALIGTYLFEEKANIEKAKKEDLQTALLDTRTFGDIVGIEGFKINMEKRGGLFYDKELGIRMSEGRINEMFQILSSLKVINFLDQEEVQRVGTSHYIPDESMKLTFRFERGDLSYVLGKKIDFDQTFYMEIIRGDSRQIVLVRDTSPDPGVYEKEEDYQKSEAKYKRLQVVYFLTNKYFHDARTFKDFNYKEDQINFDEIDIATFRNRKFTVNFKGQFTKPAPYKGINYFEDNWVSFHRFLSTLEGRSVIYPNNPKRLDEILSRFDVKDRQGRKYYLELYKKYENESGYFLKTSLDNMIYDLRPEIAQNFFVNVQDFWIKKPVIPQGDYKLGLTFYDERSKEVKVEDKQLFKILPLDNNLNVDQIRPLEFKRLLDFLKQEGNHVSEMTEKPSELLKGNVLKVNFDNRTLNVILEENEAIILDVAQKLKVHHYIGSKLPFSIKYDDYFMDKK